MGWSEAAAAAAVVVVKEHSPPISRCVAMRNTREPMCTKVSVTIEGFSKTKRDTCLRQGERARGIGCSFREWCWLERGNGGSIIPGCTPPA